MKNEPHMTDSERLVQRFVDQELSAEERVRFVARLGRDEALRQQVIELEQLALNVTRLPRPMVPEGFVAAVMERTAPATSAQSAWSTLMDAFWAPRDLRWNLASAVAVGCLALLVVAGFLARTPAPTADGIATGSSTVSTDSSTVFVRLVVLQPNAKIVQVAGDFNGWNPMRTPLERISDGAWAVTIALRPGRYEYSFVVDGDQWIADPFAAEENDDGFGSRNAVLDVRPPAEAQS
jgi:hypothetical protein